MTDVLDGTGYVAADVALAVLITLSALVSYARVAFEVVPAIRLPVPRLLMALGWTILALRFWLSLVFIGDVTAPPVALASLSLVTVGYCFVQLRAIRRALALSRDPIFCMRMKSEMCLREDRVQKVLRKH